MTQGGDFRRDSSPRTPHLDRCRNGPLEPGDIRADKPPVFEQLEPDPVCGLAQDMLGGKTIGCQPRAVKVEEWLTVPEIVSLVIVAGQMVRVQSQLRQSERGERSPM